MPTWIPWSRIRASAVEILRGKGWDWAAFPEARDRANRLFPGFADLLSALEEGTPDPGEFPPEAGEPEFRLARMSGAAVRRAVILFQEQGPLGPAAIEFFVRQGCRGHRNYRDAKGKEIPYRLESGPGGSLLLIEETFQGYVESGIALALAIVIVSLAGGSVRLERTTGDQHARRTDPSRN